MAEQETQDVHSTDLQNSISDDLLMDHYPDHSARISSAPASQRAAFDGARQAATSVDYRGGLNEKANTQESILADSDRISSDNDSFGSTAGSGIFDDSDPGEIHQETEFAHVPNDTNNHLIRTCGSFPATETKLKQLAGKELTKWAIENYTVDPIKSSKNRWRIRLRCRKARCQHLDHSGLLTVSFMSDSAYRQVSRGKKKYEQWKKQIKAESARALWQGD